MYILESKSSKLGIDESTGRIALLANQDNEYISEATCKGPRICDETYCDGLPKISQVILVRQ